MELIALVHASSASRDRAPRRDDVGRCSQICEQREQVTSHGSLPRGGAEIGAKFVPGDGGQLLDGRRHPSWLAIEQPPCWSAMRCGVEPDR
jgi:hypothetical protein